MFLIQGYLCIYQMSEIETSPILETIEPGSHALSVDVPLEWAQMY